MAQKRDIETNSNEKLYTQQEVARITGVSPNTLQAWVRDGIVDPSIKYPVSRGRFRLYTQTDIVHAAIVKALIEKSFNRQLVESLNKWLKSPLNRAGIYTTFKKAFLSPEKISENFLFTLELRDNCWTINSMELTEKPQMNTLNGYLLGCKTLIVVNVSQVLEDLKKRL